MSLSSRTTDVDQVFYLHFHLIKNKKTRADPHLVVRVSVRLQVGIIDDDIFEEDEHFFVRLLNLRVGDAEGMFESDEAGAAPKARLVEPLVATVTILDDDHAGIFTFSERMVRVSESVGTMEVTVVRNSGARGTVILPYHTESGTAKAGDDYEDARGELEFTNDQTT